jgi:CHAT domain-containing protein
LREISTILNGKQFWISGFLLLLAQLREMGLHKPVELLVLSACRTALGDEQNELGLCGVGSASWSEDCLG